MTHVHNHSDPVHFGDEQTPELRQTCVSRFVTAVGSKISRVVGEQHLNNAEPAIHFHEREFSEQSITSLECKCNANLSLCLRPTSVADTVHEHECVGLSLKVASILAEKPNRLL